MEQRLTRVAITQGDTNGVGYELIFKALEDSTVLELFTPIIYGEPKVADYHAKGLGLEPEYVVIDSADDIEDGQVNFIATGDSEPSVTYGQASEASGEAALRAIDRAIEDYKTGAIDAIVTAPLDNNAAFHFSGQSRYIEDHIEADGKGISLLVSESLRIALATRNLPLKQVMEAISQQHIEETTEAISQSIRRDFRISSPRVAVLALNPKAGDNGLLGTEEQEVLAPAIAALNEKSINAFGPYATDTFFGGNDWQQFDAIVAMYYDQALTPFRAIAFDEGCTYTAGLPIIHTAPITPALDGAGKGEADPMSLRHAIYLAIDIHRNRAGFDEPLANPLKKLYKEKREDTNRARFKKN